MEIPKYADEAAFPKPPTFAMNAEERDNCIFPSQWGLTKREYMATQIAAGIAAVGSAWPDYGDSATIAERAIHIADAMLEQLKSR